MWNDQGLGKGIANVSHVSSREYDHIVAGKGRVEALVFGWKLEESWAAEDKRLPVEHVNQGGYRSISSLWGVHVVVTVSDTRGGDGKSNGVGGSKPEKE